MLLRGHLATFSSLNLATVLVELIGLTASQSSGSELLFLVPGPLVDLALSEARVLGQLSHLLFGPIRIPLERLDKQLDLALILSHPVLLPAALAKDGQLGLLWCRLAWI